MNAESKKIARILIVYCILAALFYWIVNVDWRHTVVTTEARNREMLIEVAPDKDFLQSLSSRGDSLERITFYSAVTNPDSSMTMTIGTDDTILYKEVLTGEELVGKESYTVILEPTLENVKDANLTLGFSSETGGILLYTGSSQDAGKYAVDVDSDDALTIGGQMAVGELALSIQYGQALNAYKYIIPFELLIGIVLACSLILLEKKKGNRASSGWIGKIVVLQNYVFLLKQLVGRDFKVKYKASVLGVLWSFLNPLLTMLVYYFVFSTLFKSNTEYFPAYLMSGIVLFSYFSESVSLGMLSIVGNGGLITKVYIPKFIFPLSKVLSSAINLCISMIPLLGVSIIVGVPIRKSLLLIPWVIVFLVILSLGFSLILSTMNTFFRDTQFLWSVVVMMLNFLTPIFYPESIIPARFMTVYHMNPLYQIIYFMRCILIKGVSPTPISYLYCLISCGVPLALGIIIFKRHQDQFVLHL